MQVVFSLILVLVLILGLAYVATFLRKKSQKWRSSHFKIKEAHTLDPKNRLIVVQYKSQEYVVVLGPHGALKLDQFSVNQEADTPFLKEVMK